MTLDLKSDYISSPQAAKALRITSVGVAQLARQGKIPAVKIANRWLIPRAFVDEFARTYQGKRGRPRKSRRLAVGYPAISDSLQPAMANPDATMDFSPPWQETSGILTINAWIDDLEDTPALTTPEARTSPVETTEAGDIAAAVGAVASVDAPTVQVQGIPAPVPEPYQPSPDMATGVPGIDVPARSESRPSSNGSALQGQPPEIPAAASPEAVVETSIEEAATEAAERHSPGDSAFSISADVFHLDRNYDFEVYEKGKITEGARLIVARLKPKIPSLPAFSFRWDYRYEHLNVDIQGVEPNVKEWWTMGENGYTGHLPRRLGVAGYVFEAIIWLPVTFVFRGRLTLSLSSSPVEDDSSSVAATTGGLRRLWTRWTRDSAT